MSTYSRIALRAATATAVLAGALLVPAAAFAASGPCQVTEQVPSVLGGMSVSLTSDPATGPIAVLRDAKGGAVATVDRAHPTDLADGIKIEESKDGKAVFFQRSQGGDTAWQPHPFPALPATCTDPSATPYKLVNGETLTVTKSAQGHYRADSLAGGTIVKVMETQGDGVDVDAYLHGVHVTLDAKTGVVDSEYVDGRFGCTVTEVVPSVFRDGLSVKLTNSPEGAKAALRNSALKVIATVDRAHPVSGEGGMRLDGVNTATPRLGQATQGGGTAYAYTDFPKLPAGCASGAAAKTSTQTSTQTPNGTSTQTSTQASAKTPVNSPVQNGGQTTVVPKGAVAAGAEIEQGGSDHGMLLAGGAALAAAGGAGFVVLRRRAAARS
ncbi:hypothetical protein ACGFW5_03170 [Streptomyces sp. NPDC048416]|uniref:hypothetical protein n=1 Tax=Streptomyces sp. NPDC048416 TaxID=3365546 RepID=UPI00371B88A2